MAPFALCKFPLRVSIIQKGLPIDVTTWHVETGRYLPRLEDLQRLVAVDPPHPDGIPHPPLDKPPSPVQSVIHRAIIFYEMGLWLRTRETIAGLVCLWKEGYLSAAGSLVRLLFELWSACEFQTIAIKKFKEDGDLEKLRRTVDRLFEGVRDEVLLPWGTLASEKPIHVMDLIRNLSSVFPDAEAFYNELCESSHANQPRFLEWWVVGSLGDNWTNLTVQKRGHILLEKTVMAAEIAVRGTVGGASIGLKQCGDLYLSA